MIDPGPFQMFSSVGFPQGEVIPYLIRVEVSDFVRNDLSDLTAGPNNVLKREQQWQYTLMHFGLDEVTETVTIRRALRHRHSYNVILGPTVGQHVVHEDVAVEFDRTTLLSTDPAYAAYTWEESDGSSFFNPYDEQRFYPYEGAPGVLYVDEFWSMVQNFSPSGGVGVAELSPSGPSPLSMNWSAVDADPDPRATGMSINNSVDRPSFISVPSGWKSITTGTLSDATPAQEVYAWNAASHTLT